MLFVLYDLLKGRALHLPARRLPATLKKEVSHFKIGGERPRDLDQTPLTLLRAHVEVAYVLFGEPLSLKDRVEGVQPELSLVKGEVELFFNLCAMLVSDLIGESL